MKKKILKVLIVDDEKLICDLIQKLADWTELGLVLAGVAYDGISALELARKEKPDILISDIRIPGIDGLQLVEKTQEFLPDIKVILISGYKEFDFAVHALKLGVSDYLLKPIGKKQLNDTLCRIRNDITGDRNNERTKDSDTKVQSYQQSSRHTRESLLIQSISRPLRPFNSVKTIRSDAEYLVFILRYDIKNPYLEEDYSEQIRILSEKNAEELVASCGQTPITLVYTISRYETYFIASHHSGYSSANDLYSKAFYDICSKVSFYSNIEVTMGIGIAIDSIEDIDIAVDSARMAVNERIDKGTGRIINFNDVVLQPESYVSYQTESINAEIQKMINYVHMHEIEKFEENWKRIKDIIWILAPNYFITTIEMILEKMIIKSRVLKIPDQTRNMIQDSVMMTLYKCSTRNDYWNILERKLTIYLKEYGQNTDKNMSKTVVSAISFIEKHYMEKISLDDVAEACYINASWLSTKFKNEIGENITDYINNFRIDMAKLFLITSDYSITEISTLVGFNDSKYFSRQFRKVTGITPIEFRKIMG